MSARPSCVSLRGPLRRTACVRTCQRLTDDQSSYIARGCSATPRSHSRYPVTYTSRPRGSLAWGGNPPKHAGPPVADPLRDANNVVGCTVGSLNTLSISVMPSSLPGLLGASLFFSFRTPRNEPRVSEGHQKLYCQLHSRTCRRTVNRLGECTLGDASDAYPCGFLGHIGTHTERQDDVPSPASAAIEISHPCDRCSPSSRRRNERWKMNERL